MKNIKMYYLMLLKNILSGTWGAIITHLKINRKQRIPPNTFVDNKGNKIPQKSISVGGDLSQWYNENREGKPIMRIHSDITFTSLNTSINPDSQLPGVTQQSLGNCAIYVTTKDAYTLTDGPTIFLANDVEKIGKFCIQQSNIPTLVMEEIMKKIEFNNSLNERIDELERELEYLTEKGNSTTSLMNKDGHKLKKENRESSFEKIGGEGGRGGEGNKLAQLKDQIVSLKNMIRSVSLNDTFVPNTIYHLKKWAEEMNAKNAFTSRIEEETVNEIMLLHGIEDSWKVLLMMGIGVFTKELDRKEEKKKERYTEIMKRLISPKT